MAKRKAITKPTKARSTAKHPDAELIAHCMAHAMSQAQVTSAFSVDPDPNSRNAIRITDQHATQARQTLVRAGKIKAQTWTGLLAKAKTTLIVLGAIDIDAVGTVPHEVDFCRSFAYDAKRLIGEKVTDEWRADCSAKSSQTSGAVPS